VVGRAFCYVADGAQPRSLSLALFEIIHMRAPPLETTSSPP